MADQQFCLRWNNHQSTLVSVFDSLLERGAMVDCTLAAEGQCLQAHKVVLSACSPYLETLLSQHYDKHPILLLKDIKFYELQAMMDYMYRGEVNVAQDKLGMFLKAAESLQIKGLSESGGNEPADSGGTGTVTKRTTKSAPVTNVPRTSSLPVERRRPAPPQVVDVASDASRDGSVSPSLRKRRRRVSASEETSASAANSTDGHDAAASNSVAAGGAEITPAVPINGSTDNNALGILSSLMDGSVENDNLRESGPSLNTSTTQSSDRVREKVEPTSEVMIEPKAEYLDADEDVEDLTLDDNMDDSGMSNAGPSQRQGQGYQWHMGDQSTDEVFMAAQEAVGANRDAQDFVDDSDLPFEFVSIDHVVLDESISPSSGTPTPASAKSVGSSASSSGPPTISMKRFRELPVIMPRRLLPKDGVTSEPRAAGHFPCPDCGKVFKYKHNMKRHRNLECGKEPQFHCQFCKYKTSHKGDLKRHLKGRKHEKFLQKQSRNDKS